MQSQSLHNATAARSASVAAAVLCAAALCTSQARAQLSVGPVRIDVFGAARSSAAARTVLMASSGQRLPPKWSALKPGDLVLFAEPGERISHVAIYAGNRRIIHASSSGRRVRHDALDTKRGRWFSRRIVAARRVF